MSRLSTIFAHWRESLLHFLHWFEDLRDKTGYFYPKVFVAFVALNLLCYWWALLTAYPGLVFGPKQTEFILTGFPVAVLGALFDSLSLLVTLLLIRRALSAQNNLSYVGYLSVDLFIAVLATFWVLFAFMISGLVVSHILDNPESMAHRTDLYRWRFLSALSDPFSAGNLKNIYFGVLMGASALLPTLFHIGMAGRSLVRSTAEGVKLKRERAAKAMKKGSPPQQLLRRARHLSARLWRRISVGPVPTPPSQGAPD